MWGKWKADLNKLTSLTEYRDLLIEILNTRIQEVTAKELDPNTFGSPSWPYLQAAQVGARKELTQLLLTLDRKDSNGPIN
jgi:hypothetical protein